MCHFTMFNLITSDLHVICDTSTIVAFLQANFTTHLSFQASPRWVLLRMILHRDLLLTVKKKKNQGAGDEEDGAGDGAGDGDGETAGRNKKSLLPALIKVLYARNDNVDIFFGLSNDATMFKAGHAAIYAEDFEEDEIGNIRGLDSKLYQASGPQHMLRGIVTLCVVHVFYLMDFKYNDLIYRNMPTFGKPTCDLVTDMDTFIASLLGQDQAFAAVLGPVRAKYLSRVVCSLTHTFLCGKNWNSHGGTTAAAMCDLAGMLETAAMTDSAFFFESAKGVCLGGQKYGWEDSTTYFEYMLYLERGELDFEKFDAEDHATKVNRKFDAKNSYGSGRDYPVPRPTKGHTVDFAMILNGVKILDGECKETAREEIDFLRLISTRQFVESDLALSLHTSNSMFVLSAITEDTASKMFSVSEKEFPPFSLLPPANRVPNQALLQPKQAKTNSGKTAFVHVLNDDVLERKWGALPDPLRKTINAMLGVTDVLVKQIERAREDLPNKLQHKRDAYRRGFKEFQYWNIRPRDKLDDFLKTLMLHRKLDDVKEEWIYDGFPTQAEAVTGLSLPGPHTSQGRGDEKSPPSRRTAGGTAAAKQVTTPAAQGDDTRMVSTITTTKVTETQTTVIEPKKTPTKTELEQMIPDRFEENQDDEFADDRYDL